MTTPTEQLPDDIEALKALLLSERKTSQETIETLKAKCQYLEEQFLKARHQQFCASSEAHPAQGDLFNEAEVIIEAVEVSDTETIEYTRSKPKRQPLPKDLPREVIVHDVAEDDKQCNCCGETMHCFGMDKSEQLEFIPASIKVIEHVRPKYSCRACEKMGTSVAIKQAPMPPMPIPKSMATPSLLSQIITNKYQYALPLYRQEQLFKQHQIELSRQTMSDWVLKCAKLLTPIVEAWYRILLQKPVIQADETTLKVIEEDKHQCYMWLYCTGTDSPNQQATHNIVLYDYQSSRSGSCVREYLADYTGYLQVDGYAGYEQTRATLVGCWAHARRKYKEAEQAAGKNKTGRATWALSHIQKLYRIEKAIKDKTVEVKYQVRQAQAKPLLEQYKQWLDKSALQVPPKSAIGAAIGYSLRQWHKLSRYIDDGQLAIDNNRAERAIKPFVIGRKNFLFSNTPKGAKASANLYSIIETAKANGLIPFNYLMHLLTELPKQPDDLDYLMPWNVELR